MTSAGFRAREGHHLVTAGLQIAAGATSSDLTNRQWAPLLGDVRRVRRLLAIGADADVVNLQVNHPETHQVVGLVNLNARLAFVVLDIAVDLYANAIRILSNALAGNTQFLFLFEVEACPSP